MLSPTITIRHHLAGICPPLPPPSFALASSATATGAAPALLRPHFVCSRCLTASDGGSGDARREEEYRRRRASTLARVRTAEKARRKLVIAIAGHSNDEERGCMAPDVDAISWALAELSSLDPQQRARWTAF